MKTVVVESDPCISIEEAMRLTGWSRKEILRQIGRGEIALKFGDSKSVREIHSCKDHPAYQLSKRVIDECMKQLESPEFKALVIGQPSNEKSRQWWKRLTEASQLQAAVLR